MKYKEDHLKEQLLNSSVILQLLANDFAQISHDVGIDAVVTRIWDKVDGESGVHADMRAIDFRDKFQGEFLYNESQRNFVMEQIKKRWPRCDGFETIIWHSFKGAPHHFHLQLPVCINGLRPQSAVKFRTDYLRTIGLSSK